MLKFNFTRIFKIRGINKPRAYLLSKGYTESMAQRIVHNLPERLDLEYLEKLCVLFRCTPNDFIEWTPDSDDDENNPLSCLKRGGKAESVAAKLESAPLDKLLQIEKMLDEKSS
jgi:DNA-binding Xre family transcriptional regulator